MPFSRIRRAKGTDKRWHSQFWRITFIKYTDHCMCTNENLPLQEGCQCSGWWLDMLRHILVWVSKRPFGYIMWETNISMLFLYIVDFTRLSTIISKKNKEIHWESKNYRQQHKRWGLEGVLGRQLDAAMINPTLEFWIMRSPKSELPFKYVLLQSIKWNFNCKYPKVHQTFIHNIMRNTYKKDIIFQSPFYHNIMSPTLHC